MVTCYVTSHRVSVGSKIQSPISNYPDSCDQATLVARLYGGRSANFDSSEVLWATDVERKIAASEETVTETQPENSIPK